MITAVLLMLLISLSATKQSQEIKAGTVTVRIENLKNKSGQLGVSVYNSSKGWPDKWKQAVHSELVKIESLPADILLPDLPVGIYAVSVFHDENSSGDLDKNFMSIPKEGYGVSNNARPGSFGPPDFSESVFRLTQRDTLISIQLNY